jgi:hypothetical protein
VFLSSTSSSSSSSSTETLFLTSYKEHSKEDSLFSTIRTWSENPNTHLKCSFVQKKVMCDESVTGMSPPCCVIGIEEPTLVGVTQGGLKNVASPGLTAVGSWGIETKSLDPSSVTSLESWF